MRMYSTVGWMVCGSVLICIVSHFMVESSDSPKTDVATGPPHNIHIVKKGNPINVRYGVHTGSNHGSQRNVPKVILANEAEPNRITGASASQRLGFQRKPHLRFLNQKLLAYRNRVYAINNGKINIDGVMYVKCGLGIGLESAFICCNDVFIIRGTGPVECCGSTFYYTDNEFCCGNNILPKSIGNRQFGCCNNTFYTVGNRYCCNDQLQTTPCRDPCRSTLTPLNRLLLPESQQCCDGKTCSASCKANLSTEFCCGNTVVQKGSGVGCCSGSVYNKEEKICCGNRLFDKKRFCCRKVGPMQVLSRFCPRH